jgi:hypothetical protein
MCRSGSRCWPYGGDAAANSHTAAEYAATDTVPKNTAPTSHNTTGAGSPRNLAYAASATGRAGVRAECSLLRSGVSGTKKGSAAAATDRVLS